MPRSANKSFEIIDNSLIQHVLDLIDGPVDQAWGDISVGREVLFPQAVVAGNLASAFPTGGSNGQAVTR